MNTKGEKPEEKDLKGQTGKTDPKSGEEDFEDSVELFSSLFREESQAIAEQGQEKKAVGENAQSGKGGVGAERPKEKIPIPTPQPPPQQEPPKKPPQQPPPKKTAPVPKKGPAGTPVKTGAKAPQGKVPIPTPQPPSKQPPPQPPQPQPPKKPVPQGPPAGAKPGVQRPAPQPGPPKTPVTPPIPPADQEPAPEKEPEKEVVQAAPPAGEMPLKGGKAKKSGSILKIVLLLVLLGVLAAFGLQYFGIVDFMGTKDGKKEAEKTRIRAQVEKKRKKTPKKVAKKPRSQAKKAPAGKAPVIKPLVAKTKPPEAPKVAVKPVQKAAAPAEKPEAAPAEKPKAPAPSEKPAPAAPVAVVQKPPAPATPAPEARAPAPKPAPALSAYPYAVYLGSYKSDESLKKAVSDYQEAGLTPYWVQVDLGEKGRWYRVFTGHFPARNAAATFIREKKISDGESRNTRYANLIGVFRNREELEGPKRAVERAGHCPYVIEGPEGQFMLYTGAFYQKSRAARQNRALQAKGIASRLVER